MGNQVTIVGYDKIEYTTTLVVLSCANCGVPFGMPSSFQRDRREDGDTFYCPAGHQNVYRESEADKLREKLAAAEKRCRSAEEASRRNRNRAIDAERSRTALRGVVTRERNRVGRGHCPCCGRPFKDLEEHMARQHPDYAGLDPETQPAAGAITAGQS